jgi:hypothetical protein
MRRNHTLKLSFHKSPCSVPDHATSDLGFRSVPRSTVIPDPLTSFAYHMISRSTVAGHQARNSILQTYYAEKCILHVTLAFDLPQTGTSAPLQLAPLRFNGHPRSTGSRGFRGSLTFHHKCKGFLDPLQSVAVPPFPLPKPPSQILHTHYLISTCPESLKSFLQKKKKSKAHESEANQISTKSNAQHVYGLFFFFFWDLRKK